MKSLISCIIATLVLSTYSIEAEAQIMNRVKDKAKDKVEEKVDEKVEEKLDKTAEKLVERSWESIFGVLDSTNGDAESGGPFRLASNVSTADSYDFDVVTTMKIETTDAEGYADPPMKMHMHFKEGGEYTGTRFEGGNLQDEMHADYDNLFIIYDADNEAMIMLMESDEEKFSFAYNWKDALKQAEEKDEEVDWEETEEWNDFKKIGQKEILGYQCDGYESQNDESRTEIWVTRDADAGIQRMFGAHANTKHMKNALPEDYPHGMLMEMTTEHENGEKVTMEVTDISNNSDVSYLMADYPQMGMQESE